MIATSNTSEIFVEYICFCSHNKVSSSKVFSSFKDQPMGAVSVFTCEELPSPTLFLSEILSSFRDVVASFFLVRMSFCWYRLVLLTCFYLTSNFQMFLMWRRVGIWLNERVWYHRISRKWASCQCASAPASFFTFQTIVHRFSICCFHVGFAEIMSRFGFVVRRRKKVCI